MPRWGPALPTTGADPLPLAPEGTAYDRVTGLFGVGGLGVDWLVTCTDLARLDCYRVGQVQGKPVIPYLSHINKSQLTPDPILDCKNPQSGITRKDSPLFLSSDFQIEQSEIIPAPFVSPSLSHINKSQLTPDPHSTILQCGIRRSAGSIAT